MWDVVILVKSDEAEVVPDSWLHSMNGAVYWPPYRSTSRIRKAIKNKENVDDATWKLCPVRILSQWESYEEARKSAKEVEAVSQVDKTRPLIERDKRMSKRTLVSKRKYKVEGLEATIPIKQMVLELSESPSSQQCSRSAPTAYEFGSIIQQCSSTELAQLKRQDQGTHECEVLPEETGAMKIWNECDKNPGHANFIPVRKFFLNHLRLERQHNLVYKCVKSIAKLTVRVVVHYTSAKRPKGYPFYYSKGQKGTPHYGSGFVGCNFTQNDVEYDTAEKTCPCPECVKSSNPKTIWWSCKVITARHVVYNAKEAKNTVFEAFYDDESRSTVKTLYGYDMNVPNKDEDICVVNCATHDNVGCRKLDKAIAKTDKYRSKFVDCSDKYRHQNNNLCVVVSHPHGRSKHVSTGRWKMFFQKERRGYQEEDDLRTDRFPSAFEYTTPTCKGSSGGPVFVIDLLAGRWFNFITSDCDWHTHSEGIVKDGENLNKCSFNAVHGR